MRKHWLTIMITSLMSILISRFASAGTDGGYTPVPKSNDIHPAYIQKIYEENGTTYMVVDE
jgi:hypothetical protein